MNNYPIPVMKIASSAPIIHWKQTHTWHALYQMKHSPDDLMGMLARQAADAITHQFVDDVLKRERIEIHDDPEGKVFKFSCVALRYDQLLNLLYQAYCESQTSVPKTIVPEFISTRKPEETK